MGAILQDRRIDLLGAHNGGNELVWARSDSHQPQPVGDNQFLYVRLGVVDILHGLLCEDGAHRWGIYSHLVLLLAPHWLSNLLESISRMDTDPSRSWDLHIRYLEGVCLVTPCILVCPCFTFENANWLRRQPGGREPLKALFPMNHGGTRVHPHRPPPRLPVTSPGPGPQTSDNIPSSLRHPSCMWTGFDRPLHRYAACWRDTIARYHHSLSYAHDRVVGHTLLCAVLGGLWFYIESSNDEESLPMTTVLTSLSTAPALVPAPDPTPPTSTSAPSIPPSFEEHLTCLEEGQTRIKGLLFRILMHL